MSLKIALLASGTGSNVQAILEAIQNGSLDAQVQCVIANIENAAVLAKGEQADLPTYYIPHQGLSREQHEAALLDILNPLEIDYIVLAGYMRLMTPLFLNAYREKEHYRILNIHPSLLPAFQGARAYEEAYEYGVKQSGVTVHFIDEGLDQGPILLQESFPRYDDDTLETFKSRGLAVEHRLYPTALQLLAENRAIFRYNKSARRYYVEIKTHVPC
jgi:phosphoribosylglycinamide formyltransferase 1